LTALFQLDSQSVGSYRTTELSDLNRPCGDDTSLRSLPLVAIHQGQASTQIILSGQNQSGTSQGQLNPSTSQPRSLSPVSCQSGDDLGYANPARKSLRSRRQLLDKQLSENSSLLSGEDATSERVRFDDNVSFIDDNCSDSVNDVINLPSVVMNVEQQQIPRLLKANKLETPSLPEETPEELAQVISPEPQLRNRSHNSNINIGTVSVVTSSSPIPKSDSHEHVTLLTVGQDEHHSVTIEGDDNNEKC
jgi:hypothetical protein